MNAKIIASLAFTSMFSLSTLLSPAHAEEQEKALNFGIISTESQQNLKPQWTPFLQDMEKKLGVKVNAFFAPDYAGIIQGMRFNKVDIAWYGNLSAMEAVEAIEPGPVEGIRATGANKLEEILYGVLPQVMPLLISYSLYRFESNVRSATVVGMVGAGGIGVTLWEAIRGFQFQQTCALMVLIIVTVSLLDFLSQRLRKHFI
ncbi:hypothetical protein G964_04128 [Escherichia coli UMEA 3317-1]|nr:hypothetical protein G964_04128 [Escherichia coli UMEA 3317-1]